MIDEDRARRGGSGPGRVSIRLLILPAITAALLLLVLALPDLGPTRTGPDTLAAYHGRLVALLDPHRPDPTGSGSGFLPDARVTLFEGPDAGREIDAYLQGPGGQPDATGYRVGEDVVVTYSQQSGDPAAAFVAVDDRWRLPQLGLLALLFAVAVTVVGGWRGLRALLALALTVAVVIRILVPLLVQGVPPIPVAVVLGILVTVLTIGLTEGFNRVGVAAILGTAGALAFTALLAAATIALTAFSNAVGSDIGYLQTTTGVGLDLRGLLLAAFMFGAIGVLDDVTVTQAAAVEELVGHTELRGRQLFASAFNLGRSHIAATVNTLFLAYLGASLPLIVLFVVSQQPVGLIVNGELVAIEIVRTLVGGLGIVAAVPFTTGIAVWLVASRRGPQSTMAADPSRGLTGRLRHPAAALVAGLAAIGIVTAGAAVALAPMIVSPPRSALVQDRFEPSAAASSGPAPSIDVGASTAPIGDPPIIQAGAAMPIVDGSTVLGSVVVLQVRTEPGDAGGQTLLAEIRYQASGELPITPDAWLASPLEGEPVFGHAAAVAPSLQNETLQAGDDVTGWVAFDLAAESSDVFLAFLDPAGSTTFIVTP